jgi:hypothetical protein
MAEIRATGRCLCGAVSYEVRGPLRDILLCHCVECRRWGGHAGSFAATRTDDLVIGDTDALRWIDSPESDHDARRAFCSACGSSLFWQAAGSERTGIAAGTLDDPTGLRVVAHIYSHQAGDYELLEDGLPRDPDRSTLDIRWS